MLQSVVMCAVYTLIFTYGLLNFGLNFPKFDLYIKIFQKLAAVSWMFSIFTNVR